MNKIVLIFLVYFSDAAASDDKINVVTEQWAPYNYRNQQGEIVGSATEKVKAILTRAGLEYSISIYPWTRSFNLALHKPNTAIYSIVKTAEREPYFHWFCPLFKVQYFVFKRKDDPDVQINQFADIKKYTLGLSRGTFFYDLLIKEGYKEGKNFHATSNNLANVREILHKRVQIIADTKENILIQLHNLGESPDALEAAYPLKILNNGENCLALNINTSKDIVDKIGVAFKQLSTLKSSQ